MSENIVNERVQSQACLSYAERSCYAAEQGEGYVYALHELVFKQTALCQPKK